MYESARLRSIDIARGIGILSIIAGHFGIPAIVRVVFTFHIPVFYLITGYFMKEEAVPLFLRKKAETLLLPYMITCMAVVVLQGITALFNSRRVAGTLWIWIKAGFYGAGSSYHLPESFTPIGAVWFLWATFWGSLLMQIVLRRNQVMQAVWTAVLFAFGYLTAHKFLWLPFDIQPGCCAVLYMYAGYIAGKNEDRIKKWVKKAWPAAFFVWFAFIYTFTSFALVRCDYGKGAIDIAASLGAAHCIFFLSEMLDRAGGRTADVLDHIGRCSLVILCVHLVEMDLVDWWAVVDRFQMIGIPRLAGCCAAVGMKMVTIFGGTLMVTGLGKMIRKKTESR